MLEFDESQKTKLFHEEVTKEIIGASFELHRELGYGFLERVYQRALQVELVGRGSLCRKRKTSSGAIQRCNCWRLRCRLNC